MVVSNLKEVLNLEVVCSRYWKFPIFQWWVEIIRDTKIITILALILVITSPSCCLSSYWHNSDLEGIQLRICKLFRMPFNAVMRADVT